ncbi:MAG: hypothetical protein HZC17_09185, partial [Candidatus Omnitrophica bacterium]|nr:hypothetical protein [Candidatus Omnitrophota bacterium]
WVGDPKARYLFCQLLHIGAIFIPAFFLHFVLTYLDLIREKQKWILRAAYAGTFIFLAVDLLFPHLFISETMPPRLGFGHFMNPNLFYHFYIVFFFLIVLYTHVLLLRSVFESHGQLQKQRLFFLLGNVLGYGGSISIFGIIYGIPIFPFPLGSYGVCLFSFVTVFTIVQFRFMDIEVLIKKTFVFAGLFALVISIVAFVTAVTQSFVGIYLRINPHYSQMLSVVIAIILYQPTRKFLIHITNRFLFQKKFDFKRLLHIASEGLFKVRSLNRLARLIVTFLTFRTRIQNAAVYAKEIENNTFVLKARRGYASALLPYRFSGDDVLIQFLAEKKKPLRYESLLETIKYKSGDKESLFAIRKQMEELKADLIIPSFRGDISGRKTFELANILVLGKKKSDEAYSEEEIHVFFTLAHESAVACENARLYDEIVEKLKELQSINQKLETSNTQIKEKEARLIVTQRTATLVNMARAIGHEIHNPLSVSKAWIDDLLTKDFKELKALCDSVLPGRIPESSLIAIKQHIRNMEEECRTAAVSAERIEGSVETLTHLLKNCNGELMPIDFQFLYEECLKGVEISDCRIQSNIAPKLILKGNLEQLIRVFTCLFEHSLNAMKEESIKQIWIEADKDPEKPGMANIEFRDSGPHVDSSIRHIVWNQQLSTESRSEGRQIEGNGLYIAKHIVESIHKGKMILVNRKEGGVSFQIRLPLAKEDSQ